MKFLIIGAALGLALAATSASAVSYTYCHQSENGKQTTCTEQVNGVSVMTVSFRPSWRIEHVYTYHNGSLVKQVIRTWTGTGNSFAEQVVIDRT